MVRLAVAEPASEHHVRLRLRQRHHPVEHRVGLELRVRDRHRRRRAVEHRAGLRHRDRHRQRLRRIPGPGERERRRRALAHRARIGRDRHPEVVIGDRQRLLQPQRAALVQGHRADPLLLVPRGDDHRLVFAAVGIVDGRQGRADRVPPAGQRQGLVLDRVVDPLDGGARELQGHPLAPLERPRHPNLHLGGLGAALRDPIRGDGQPPTGTVAVADPDPHRNRPGFRPRLRLRKPYPGPRDGLDAHEEHLVVVEEPVVEDRGPFQGPRRDHGAVGPPVVVLVVEGDREVANGGDGEEVADERVAVARHLVARRHRSRSVES